MHEEQGNWEMAVHISCWLNDMEWISKQIQLKKVNELIIFFTFMKSRKLFVTAVRTFVDQLIQEKEFYRAVDYLILINELKRAVDILVGLKMYRDAITLITYNTVQGEQSLLNEVKTQWIEQLMSDGNYELASKL